MFLQLKDNGDLIKITNLQELIDPNSDIIHGQDQVGEEEQDIDVYQKESLVFPSGEQLPRCWLDANYRTVKIAYFKS